MGNFFNNGPIYIIYQQTSRKQIVDLKTGLFEKKSEDLQKSNGLYNIY